MSMDEDKDKGHQQVLFTTVIVQVPPGFSFSSPVALTYLRSHGRGRARVRAKVRGTPRPALVTT